MDIIAAIMCCENDIEYLGDCINSVLSVDKDIRFDIQFNKGEVKSFADLRNKQLDKIRGKSDWILIIDPDERLKGVLNFKDSDNAKIIGIKKIQKYLGRILSENYEPRLFRNTRYAEFSGDIHETVCESFSPYCNPLDKPAGTNGIYTTTSIRIEHLDLDVTDKVLRNEKLLDLSLRDHRFYHANHLYLLGKENECVSVCEALLAENIRDWNEEKVLHILIPIYINNHRDKEAEELFRKYDYESLKKYNWVFECDLTT